MPSNHNEMQAMRIAARNGLHFHIDRNNYLTEHAGWKSETRPATEAEQSMWAALCPPEWCNIPWYDEVPSLDAIPDELVGSLYCKKGPVYLNAADIAVLRRIDGFEVCTMRELLLDRMIGTFEEEPIYAVREVPKGYVYLPQKKVGCLHWRPNPKVREIRPSLDPEAEMDIGFAGPGFNLRPLMVDGGWPGVRAKLRTA
jgi:hypothetical protein